MKLNLNNLQAKKFWKMKLFQGLSQAKKFLA